MKSIIPGNDEYCFICKQVGIYNRDTEEHHMLFGIGKRPLSEADGLKVNLCSYHHKRLHGKYGEHKKELQQLAEKVWLDHYNKGIEDFIKRYGKNYL